MGFDVLLFMKNDKRALLEQKFTEKLKLVM